MRRLGGLLALVAAAAIAVLLVGSASSGASGSAKVDAIFPNAGFLIPGQQVKVAGAVVGKVTDVTLTPDYKARISMEIDRPFATFKTDGACTIQPQSLIGEKFIDCNPGSADAPALKAQGDTPPTLPIARNHAPIDLDLVLATFRQPTTTRLSLLLSGLGGGLTGRGTDLNAAIRSAAPALEKTKRLLDEANSDRETLKSLVTEADRVVGVLDDRKEQVASFITDARRATETTAARRTQLQATLRGLPGLLRQARPALANIESLADDGTPALRDLRRATPAVTRLVGQISPFTRSVQPTITALGTTARQGRATVPVLNPQLRRLARLSEQLRPVASSTAQLFASLRDKGAIEGILSFVYYATAAQARYDGTSHILPAYAIIKDSCSLYAEVTTASCDANFNGGGRTAAARKAPAKQGAGKGKDAPAKDAPKAEAPAPTPASPSAKPPILDLPKTLNDVTGNVGKLLEGVLGNLTGKQGQTKQGDGASGSDNAVTGLLDYLLKP